MALNSIGSFTPGPWRVGKHMTTVVSNHHVNVSHKYHGTDGGVNDTEYYGGNLIAESVLCRENAILIATTPDMYKLLNDLVISTKKEQLDSTIRKAKELLSYITEEIDGAVGVK